MLDRDTTEAVIDLYENGEPMFAIAEKMKLEESTVRDILREYLEQEERDSLYGNNN